MSRIKNFLLSIWYYISYPYYRLATRKIDEKLTRIAEKDRAALLNKKDAEFLRHISVGIRSETSGNGDYIF